MSGDLEVLNAQILERLNSIDNHLSVLNGRIGKVESLTQLNDKNLAIITTEFQIQDDYRQEISKRNREDTRRIELDYQRTEDRFFTYVKENGVQIGSLAALIAILVKIFGLL